MRTLTALKHLLGRHNQKKHGHSRMVVSGPAKKPTGWTGGTGEKPTGFALEALTIVKRLGAKAQELDKESLAAEKEMEAIQREVEAHWQRKALIDPAEWGRQLDELGKRKDEASERRANLFFRADDLRQSLRERVWEHFSIPEKERAPRTHLDALTQTQDGSWRNDSIIPVERAKAFLGRMLSKELVEVCNRLSPRTGMAYKNIRANFDCTGNVSGRPTRPTLFISAQNGPNAVVHEYGHLLEYASKAVSEAGFGFLHDRVDRLQDAWAHRNDTPEELIAWKKIAYASPLREISGQKDFAPDEVAIPDHFVYPYIGKLYMDAYPNGHMPTEVISSGLELLYSHPAELAETDPEFFNFIIQTIQPGRAPKKPGYIKERKRTEV